MQSSRNGWPRVAPLGALAALLSLSPLEAVAGEGDSEAAASAAANPEPAPSDDRSRAPPSPLEVDYAQYGLAIGGNVNLAEGPICPTGAVTPCILGSGGGLTLRGGYRPAGPWYFGGAYHFSKLDSNNLFRLGIFQEFRYEMRYFLDFGSVITPYIEWGAGGCLYGNLWGVDTGGALLRAGGGMEIELTRFAVVGLDLAYEPVLLGGYTDTTNQKRDTGLTQFLHAEVVFEVRSELGRE